ncbi:polysaccharide lyase family protein [Paenibacillus gallinarum]|uniref:rhamnogalacturonan endolyase n=1 Tax=Paenibacillus gallinarum TaxID=2762232 RepID=A0ABR8SVP0_9BACL|nr:polysaccharide lyase family protein [Paenibacillus gallinarum]MBD7967550.1 lyase [Paenibacillus gallinarum]
MNKKKVWQKALRSGTVLALVVLLWSTPLFPAFAESLTGNEQDTKKHSNKHEASPTVTDNGETLTLDNGIVNVIIHKSSGVVQSLTHKGGPNLLGNGGSGYYILNYAVNGVNKKFGPTTELQYELTASDKDHIDVGLTLSDPAVLPFDWELHFVLSKGESGLYFYTVVGYPEDVPGGVSIGQGRYAFRADPHIFTQYAVDDERQGLLPTPEEMVAGEEVMDATVKLPNGEVYTKYNHIQYVGDLNVSGLYGDQTGLSIIRPSNDFVDGGPTIQRNSLHQTETTPILLWHEHESHYGRSNVIPYAGWQKIYGPSFLYVNEGDGLSGLWKDAKKKAAIESKKWPYAWLDNPLYDAKSRGEVTGKLKVNGKAAANSWVILADPSPDFQDQNLNYNYYVRTDKQGKFTLSDVRAGSYTLYSFVNGYFGEYRLDGVTVAKNKTTKLSTLEWNPETHGKQLWQIGTPDRSSGEFRNGADYHQWGSWLNYPLQFPDGVNFVIGESDEQTDWNYAHPVNATPGEPAQLKTAFDPSPAVWKIRFNEQQSYEGTAVLTFGIAGSRNGSLNAKLNGTEIVNLDPLPGPKSDSSMPRSAVHGFYREFKITFDASLLQEGENVITLQHARNVYDEQGNRTGDIYTSILYDAIRLEVDEHNE